VGGKDKDAVASHQQNGTTFTATSENPSDCDLDDEHGLLLVFGLEFSSF
jgi:hypothetical protein